jgi:amino acid transporter
VDRPVRKRVALPVLASDALSSIAYAPDEILLTLALAGVPATALSPVVGLAVVVVMVVVTLSYRQTVHAYPSGGGDYEVVTRNLGAGAGLVVAAAILLDYLLTVAVSVSSATTYVTSVVGPLQGYRTPLAVGLIAVLAAVALAGRASSGRLLAVVGQLFMVAIGALAVVGAVRELALGGLPAAPSAGLEVVPVPAHDEALATIGGAFLVLRAFSSGAVALTGVETITTAVPTFRRPRAANAALTLVMLGAIASILLMAVLWLARVTDVRVVADPAQQLRESGAPVGEDYHQDPVLHQVAQAVLGGEVLPAVVAALTAAILLIAAMTVFHRFPRLAGQLAKDELLPRHLWMRGNRVSVANGIIALAVGSAVIVWVAQADVVRLIALYLVGVFISFTLSQAGMVRHWTTVLHVEQDRKARRAARRSRRINALGLVLTSLVLVIALTTKLTRGAWVSLLVLAVGVALMALTRMHYADVRRRLAVPDDARLAALPARHPSLDARVRGGRAGHRRVRPAARPVARRRRARPAHPAGRARGRHAATPSRARRGRPPVLPARGRRRVPAGVRGPAPVAAHPAQRVGPSSPGPAAPSAGGRRLLGTLPAGHRRRRPREGPRCLREPPDAGTAPAAADARDPAAPLAGTAPPR